MYNMIYNDPYNRCKTTYPYVTWDNVFTLEEINSITEYCDTAGTDMGTILIDSGEKKDHEEFRVSNIKFHKRNENTAWIFDRLNLVIQAANEQFYNFNLNGYSDFQYTTYDINGRYDWHTDIAFGEAAAYNDIQPRKLSLSLLLNEDFEGGEFQVNQGKEENPLTVPLHKGRIVLFPSFMIHRVKPVTKGTRKSLVVWVMGPKFV